MKRLLIVYHSMTGGTLQMAQAAAEGAATESSVHVRVLHAADAAADDLMEADGYIFATPENLAAISGMLKDFFDRTYEQARGKVFRKPYVVFISAGNDGTGALRNIERIALGYQFKKVYEPVISKGLLTEETLEKCRELGQTLAGGCVEGIY